MQKLDGGRISSFQIMCLLFLVRVTATTISFPFIMGNESPTDAWIGIIIGIIASLFFLELIIRLGMKFPDMTIIQYSQAVLGKVLGKAVGLLLIWFWVSDAATTIRALGAAIVSSFMPETPMIVFIILVVLLAANAARNGIEVIARWSELVAIGVIASGLVLVLPYPAMDFKNLKPILPYGLLPHLKSSLTIIAFYMRLNIVGMIIPLAHNRKEVLRYSRYAVFLSGILLLGHTIALVAVFGSQATTLAVPGFTLARQIFIGQFFERIETIPVSVWVLNALVKIALDFWAAATGLAQVFGLRNFKPLTYPIGALAASFTMLFFESLVDEMQFIKNIWPIYSILIILGVTLVLYLASVVNKNHMLEVKPKDTYSKG